MVASTSGLVAAGQGAAQVIDQVYVQLIAMLGLRTACFESGDCGPRGLRLDEHGALQWGSTRWNLREHGYPDEPIDLPARRGGQVRGCFVLADLSAAALANESADNR